jgi:PleD family two-component response regulator
VALVSSPHTPIVLVVDYDVTRLARTRAVLESEGHLVAVARDSAMAAAVADASIGVLLLADEMQLVPTRRLVGNLREHVSAVQSSARERALRRAFARDARAPRRPCYVFEADGPERS